MEALISPGLRNWFGKMIGTDGSTLQGDGIISAFMLFWFGIGFAFYFVFPAIAKFTIARRRGVKCPWLAWIPIGGAWLLGSIADQYDRFEKGTDRGLRRIYGIGLLLAAVLFAAVFALAYAGTGSFAENSLMILVLIPVLTAVSVLEKIVLFKVYHSCTPRNAVWMLILSIFVAGASPIILFCIRKKDEGFAKRQESEGAPC